MREITTQAVEIPWFKVGTFILWTRWLIVLYPSKRGQFARFSLS